MRGFIKVSAILMVCMMQTGLQAATATAWNTLYQTTENLLKNQGNRDTIADNIKTLRGNAAKFGGQTYLNRVRRLEAMLDVQTLIAQGNIAQAEKSIKVYGGQKELKPIVPQLQQEVKIARGQETRSQGMGRIGKGPVVMPEKPATPSTRPVVVMPRERTMPITAPVATPVTPRPSPVVTPRITPTTPAITVPSQQQSEETLEKVEEWKEKLQDWGEKNQEKSKAIFQLIIPYLGGLEATTNINTLPEAERDKMMDPLYFGIYQRREQSLKDIEKFIEKYCADLVNSGRLVEKKAEIAQEQPEESEIRIPRKPIAPESPLVTPLSPATIAATEQRIAQLIEQIREQRNLAHKALEKAKNAAAAKPDPRLDLLNIEYSNTRSAVKKAGEAGQEAMELAESLIKIKGDQFVDDIATQSTEFVSETTAALEAIGQLIDASKIAPIKTPQQTPGGGSETAQEQYLSYLEDLQGYKVQLEKNKAELERIRLEIPKITSVEALEMFSSISLLSGKDLFDKASYSIKIIISLSPVSQEKKSQASSVFATIKQLKNEIDNLLVNVQKEINEKSAQFTPGFVASAVGQGASPEQVPSAPSAQSDLKILQEIESRANYISGRRAAAQRTWQQVEQGTTNKEILKQALSLLEKIGEGTIAAVDDIKKLKDNLSTEADQQKADIILNQANTDLATILGWVNEVEERSEAEDVAPQEPAAVAPSSGPKQSVQITGRVRAANTPGGMAVILDDFKDFKLMYRDVSGTTDVGIWAYYDLEKDVKKPSEYTYAGGLSKFFKTISTPAAQAGTQLTVTLTPIDEDEYNVLLAQLVSSE